MKLIYKTQFLFVIILALFFTNTALCKEINNAQNKTISKKAKDKIKEIKEKGKKIIGQVEKKVKNPNYPKDENDIIIKKDSKIEKISKKVEKAKKEFYEYIDDDIRPLTFLLTPCMNFFWSSKGKASEYKSWGADSFNIIRFMVMYDIQISNSNFFLSPGIGWANQDYVFDKYCLFKSPGKKNSKVIFKKSLDIIKDRISDLASSDSIDKVSTGLHTNYLEFVGEIQFRSNKLYYKEGFFAALGFKLGFLLTNPKTYIQFIDKNDNNEQKIHWMKESLGLDTTKLALIFRFGLGSFGGFVEWTFSNILNSEKMEDENLVLKPLTVGITIDLI